MPQWNYTLNVKDIWESFGTAGFEASRDNIVERIERSAFYEKEYCFALEDALDNIKDSKSLASWCLPRLASAAPAAVPAAIPATGTAKMMPTSHAAIGMAIFATRCRFQVFIGQPPRRSAGTTRRGARRSR